MPATDIFCAVIDNHGDIGVCWRLARQLHREYGEQVRLWVDDLPAFRHLAPGLDPQLPVQHLDGIEVRHWTADSASGVEPGDRVIEGFGCRTPVPFLQAMTRRSPSPLWLNLEYLSAEPWTLDCHGLPSPHPQLPLRQYFYFPGFDPRSGGLLRERDLIAQRDAFQSSPGALARFWSGLGCADAPDHAYRLSLFAYENPAMSRLLDALADGSPTVFLAVTDCKALGNVSTWAGRPLQPGDRVRRGRLTCHVLPFLAHADYDRLLQACDINLVRGEDSLVRAHWANRPLLWHLYPQGDDTHLVKLEAWLDRFRSRVPPAWCDVQTAWNRGDAASPLWPEILTLAWQAAPGFAEFIAQLAAQPDLASRLTDFSAKG